MLKTALTLLLFIPSLLLSQMDSLYNCASSSTAPNYRLLPHKTSVQGQYMRIMIVYVKFDGDDETGIEDDYRNVWWRNEDKPQNPYTLDHSFIDNTEQNHSTPYMDRYRQYTISDYFCEMSRGDFDIIGEEYHVTTLHEADWYHTNGNAFDYGYINREVLLTLENTVNPDFSRYNNWWRNGTEYEWAPGEGDYQADMIVMVYRNVPGGREWFFGNYSGLDDLNIWPPVLNFDGTEINGQSGVTCISNLDNYSKVTQVWEHEICHRFWGHHSIGLMTGLEDCTYGMNPWERADLEYIAPTIVSYPYSGNYSDYELEDFYATGDAVKIQLPNSSEYFWITNHQKESMYDGISHGSKYCWETNRARQDPYCGEGKGLFIYHEITTTNCGNNFGMSLDVEEAEGKYSWTIDRWVNNFIPGNPDLPIFEKNENGLPISGKQEYFKILGSGFYKQISDNPCSQDPENYFITIDSKGDGKDAFNMEYDEIFSPYSNPRSNECDGDVSGLTVKLLENDHGIMTIRVYFNNEFALEELPPSKPKNMQGHKAYISQYSFHPKITWDSNIEEDFIDKGKPGYYNIYRGYLTECDPENEPSYTYLTSVAYDVTQYVDASVTLYDPLPPATSCPYRSYSYKIEAVDNTNLISLRSERAIINGWLQSGICENWRPGTNTESIAPKVFSLLQNYPNPFNPTTDIKFELPEDNFVTVKIYNAIGEEVFILLNNEWKNTGRYEVKFNGANLASGIYFYSISAGSFKDTKKMVLIK